MQSAGAGPSNSPYIMPPEFPNQQSAEHCIVSESDKSPLEETSEWISYFDPQALLTNSREEGKENPPTLSTTFKIHETFEDVGIQEQSRKTTDGTNIQAQAGFSDMGDNRGSGDGFCQVGRGSLEDPNSGTEIVPSHAKQGDDLLVALVPSQHKKHKKRKNWKDHERKAFHQLRSEAENKGYRRGEPLWNFISHELSRQEIRATPEECKNHGDTSRRITGASKRKCPRNSQSNNLWSFQKLIDTTDDKMKLVNQTKLSSGTGGIVGHGSLGEGDGEGDEDMLGTEKSQLASDYSVIIALAIRDMVQALKPLCTNKNQLETLKTIVPQVKLQVGTKVKLAFEDLEPKLNLGKALREFRVTTIIRKEVETAFERISSILLRSAQLEDELRDIKEKNRIVQEEIQTLQAQPASSHLFKDTENAIHYDIPHNDTQIG